MVTETLEEQVIALVRKHYGTVITGRSPEITPDSDIDADIGIDWADAEGLMEEFFEKFSVDITGGLATHFAGWTLYLPEQR